MTRTGVRAAQYVFLLTGIALLAFCAYEYSQMQRFQRDEARRFEETRDQAGHRAGPGAPPIRRPPPPAGATIGRIAIPRVEVRAIVRQGEDERTLARAVGHLPDTALPGENGNVVFAGHRDTFFRGLRNVRRDDVVVVETVEGDYRYKVFSTEVVDPHNVSSLKPTAEPVLTLVTCYPFYFVGHAPKRFVVRAKLVQGDEEKEASAAEKALDASAAGMRPAAALVRNPAAKPHKRQMASNARKRSQSRQAAAAKRAPSPDGSEQAQSGRRNGFVRAVTWLFR